MSAHGIILIDIVGLVLVIVILNLVRSQKLHAGYAIIWLLSVLGVMITISFPPLLALVTDSVGAIFPNSTLSLLGFIFVFLMLIFFSVHLSLLYTRQIQLAQSQALSELLAQERQPPGKLAEDDPDKQRN